jgi:type I restriction enzyme S subunit
VLFGKRRAYQRKVAVAEFEAVVSGDIYVLKPKNESLLAELLPYLCLSERFFEHAVGTSAGSLSPRTNWSSLASFEFDLPPLDQQRRIAEILWAVDAEGQEWLKTKAVAELMQDTFVEHSLAEFEGKSLRVPLVDMIQIERPLCYGIVQPGGFSSEGTPFIRVCDMEGGNVNVASLMRVSDSVNRQYRRSTLATGDILVSIVGTIGRVAIVGPECDGFNIARAVARIAPSEHILSDFLAFLLRASSSQHRLVGSSFESARKTLNLSALEVLEFPLPDKKQQSAFMKQLNVLHEALGALTTKLEASSKLQLSIANQVFS